MADTPWLGDTCSLVDAFRSGERSPVEELEASLAAIEASTLNCFSFLDPEQALERAKSADVSKPFGGVPLGVKELDSVKGWPDTDASLLFRDRIADHDGTMVRRIRDDGGAVPVGMTTASEFGGLNVSVTKLNGVTGNAWDPTRTAGGSSGGSATAVAGGLVTIATGGDGGGSIRIPAGFCGLVGMKGTVGRIPRGPKLSVGPQTVVTGCLARSVRDVARWYDVAAGYDSRDPYSLPKIEGWERDLGTHDLSGLRIAILPDLDGAAIVLDELAELIAEVGEQLAKAIGATLVNGVSFTAPSLGLEWALTNLATLRHEVGDLWPACKDDMTDAMAFGMQMAEEMFSLDVAAKADAARTKANEAVADLFDQVDIVLCATNPDTAYPAHIGTNTRVGDRKVGLENNGALTIPANIVGNPSCQVPIGVVNDLPVGMQIMGRHHTDALLLDLAHVLERERPWALTAPLAPL